MNAMPPALQFLLLTFAGWTNRRQQKVIDYLLEEIGRTTIKRILTDLGIVPAGWCAEVLLPRRRLIRVWTSATSS